MIRVLLIAGVSKKQEIFNDFDPSTSTWVVADVQSRGFLQERLLEKHGCLSEQSVMVAGELWQELLFHADPQYRLISEDMARSLIWEWLRPLNLAWAKTPASARQILQQLEFLAPILAHQGHEPLIHEWFESNRESVIRWRHWYEVGKTLWQRFEEHKWAMASWIPALLVQPTFPQAKLSRRTVFDLGVRISPVEMQLVRELAKHQEIDVVVPKPEWAQNFATTWVAYQMLESERDQKPSAGFAAFSSEPRYRRFSTHLAEVKDATAQIRIWLQEGVPPSRIAIVTPDMEVYGSTLHAYIEQEGIPVQRRTGEPLHSHPDVSRWLSEIRLKLNRFDRKDLEVHLFQDTDETAIPYDEFRRLFARFYDVDDLKRWPELESRIGIDRGLRCTQPEFLDWSLKLCPRGADLEKVAALTSEFCKDGMTDCELAADVWAGMLEDMAARLPIQPAKTDREGIFILNLSASEWMPASHVCFLNASENVLRRWNDSPFGAAESGKLVRDLGFAVASHETQPSEFELCWLMNRPLQSVEFYFAESDFGGKALTPSRFWLLGAHAKGNWRSASSPRICRWDEIQKTDFGAIAGMRRWTHQRRLQTETALLTDLGLMAPSVLPAPEHLRLSASSLERFQKCAFVFAAEKIFGLRDEAPIDLDLDRMSRGRLMHAMFARMTMPFRDHWSDDELLRLVDECREAEGIQLGDERLWAPLRAAHVRLAKQFLRLESDWRQKHPASRTLATEMPFECGWDAEKAEWRKDGAIRFSGRLDRVDGDGDNHYLVIDYKSSEGNVRNWKSWLDNDQLQLALYSELLENGLTPLAAGTVDGAVYYVTKSESRNQGFYCREAPGQLFTPEPRARNFITGDEKQELYQSIRILIQQTIEKIRTGNLAPEPKKPSICQECSWNRLCRAPHLG